MFKCPKCSPECEVYDEVNKTCMHNTKLIEVHDVDVGSVYETASACLDDMA
jgi:predicted nucleic-acid-binding Zn-ribbon protein